VSYFFTLEWQMKHIARVLAELRRRDARSFEPSPAAAASYVARMRARLPGTVFEPGRCARANSYYFDHRGHPALIRPESVFGAHAAQQHFPLSDYDFE
jgi:hypothetical protein